MFLFSFFQVEVSLSATAKKKRKVGGAGEVKGGAQQQQQQQQPPSAQMKASNLQGQVLTPAQLQSLLQQVAITTCCTTSCRKLANTFLSTGCSWKWGYSAEWKHCSSFQPSQSAVSANQNSQHEPIKCALTSGTTGPNHTGYCKVMFTSFSHFFLQLFCSCPTFSRRAKGRNC